jgi:hypothetical protein
MAAVALLSAQQVEDSNLLERFLKSSRCCIDDRATGMSNTTLPRIYVRGRTDTLVFMHVPKSAGISMINSITGAIGPRAILRGHDLCLFGDFDDFGSLDSQVRNEIYTDKLPSDHFEFAGGHMAYSTLRRRFPNGRFITVFRHPAARLISHFFFWRSLPDNALRPWGAFGERMRLACFG